MIRILFAGRTTKIFLFFISLTAGFLLFADHAHAQASVSGYGTFHSIGITADINGEANKNATAVPSYRLQGSSEPFKTGMALSRVSDTRFTGSLFWLNPGKTYDIQVQFNDPDGGALDGLLRTFTATTRAELSSPSPVRRLHVSANGTNTNCGANNPCSLAAAVGLAKAGDEVQLSTGRYFTGGLGTQRSGTATAPIVFRSAPDAQVILDGAYPKHFAWEPMGRGLYRTNVELPGTHLVVADGQRLMAYRSLADLKSLHWGLPGIFADGNTLYIKLKKRLDPNGRYIAVSRFNDAFTVMHDHIHFEDLEFNHYGHGDYASTIFIQGGSNIVVQRNRFVNNDVDIGLKFASGENVFQDNTFIDTVDQWPWDAVKSGRGDGQIELGAIMIYGPMSGRGNVIRRNSFRGQFDALRTCAPDAEGVVSDTDVYDNVISQSADDGIEADGDCPNVRIWNNTISDVLVGISTSPAKVGPTYLIRNLIYRTGYGNNKYPGSSFKFNNGFSGYTGPVYLFHNTIDSVLDNSHGIDLKSPGNWVGIVSRNNIYRGKNYAIKNVNTRNPVDFDYDNFIGRRFALWGSREQRSLKRLRSTTKQFANALSVDPGFKNPANGDYTLNPSSSLVDVGIPLPGINDGFAGSAPDVGAFELR